MNVYSSALILLFFISFSDVRNERCSYVLNKAVDYTLYRFLSKELYRSLPDADLGRVELTQMLLSGLNTIHRRCDVQLTHENGTVRAAGCVGANHIRVSMHATVRIGFLTFTVYPGALVENLNIHFKGSARMEKGAVGKLEVLKVESWKPKLKFNGKLAVINWIFNLALKTALKNFIIKKVMEEVTKLFHDLLRQHPL